MLFKIDLLERPYDATTAVAQNHKVLESFKYSKPLWKLSFYDNGSLSSI